MQFPEWSTGIGKALLKLDDGSSYPGVFRGEIVRFYQHWKDNRPTICKGRDVCELCKAGDKGTGRFRINFLMQEDGKQWVAKVFEQGRRVYDQLVTLNKDCPLEKLKVRITRTGKGQQTNIQVGVLPGEQGLIKPDLEKILQGVALHDLSADLREPEEDPGPEFQDTPF